MIFFGYVSKETDPTTKWSIFSKAKGATLRNLW